MKNGKLEVGKPRSLIKVPQRKLRGFQLRIFGFGYCAKWKTRNENLGKLILQGFPVFQELRVFDLVERFRGLEQCLGGFYKAERGLKNFGGAWEGTEKIGGEILGGALREDSLGLCLMCFEVNVSVNSKPDQSPRATHGDSHILIAPGVGFSLLCLARGS